MTETAVEPDRTVASDHIIFATTPVEAQKMAEALGLEFDQVQWFLSGNLLGEADVSAKQVHYSAAFTHRADYAATRERVKRRG